MRWDEGVREVGILGSYADQPLCMQRCKEQHTTYVLDLRQMALLDVFQLFGGARAQEDYIADFHHVRVAIASNILQFLAREGCPIGVAIPRESALDGNEYLLVFSGPAQ